MFNRDSKHRRFIEDILGDSLKREGEAQTRRFRRERNAMRIKSGKEMEEKEEGGEALVEEERRVYCHRSMSPRFLLVVSSATFGGIRRSREVAVEGLLLQEQMEWLITFCH